MQIYKKFQNYVVKALKIRLYVSDSFSDSRLLDIGKQEGYNESIDCNFLHITRKVFTSEKRGVIT